MGKCYTIAILGVGARGADVYGRLMATMPERFKIASLCDLKQERLDIFGEEFGVPVEERFLDENDFFKKKRAEVIIIATQDADHVRHALRAIELGYDVLLEKPITDSEEECIKLLEAQKKHNKKVMICHVLRYAPAFVKAYETIKSGEIGKLVAIEALERVGYWHQAHSFVRGNWRSTEYTAPMILAKCCHDLDLLQYYAGSKCKTISSIGNLSYFLPENAPDGASKRCIDCKYMDTCTYSAKKIYIDMWKNQSYPTDTWPFNIISQAPNTEESLYAAIENGPYGRCVFHCDNNVVDHEITSITFENGVKASLIMMGFTQNGGRRINFFGTEGELVLEEENDALTLKKFGKESVPIDFKVKKFGGYYHGGGDYGLINALYEVLEGDASASTSLEASVESHLMGIAAEKSRLENGNLITLHK